MLTIEKKKALYRELNEEVKALISINDPLFTNLGNIAATIKYKFNWFWVGFYKVDNKELVLNAFQGPSACTRIGWKKGVCGMCWFKNEPIIVNDVSLFKGHITCNIASKAEVVFPVKDKNGDIKFILDIDHNCLNAFSNEDLIGMKPVLETIANIL